MYVPDHQFVLATTLDVVRILGREDVVRYVRANTMRGIVAPVDLRGHGLDLGNVVAFGELAACVDIALDLVLAALPRPGRAPLDAGSGRAFVEGALRA